MTRRDFIDFCLKCGVATSVLAGIEVMPLIAATARADIHVGVPEPPQPLPISEIELTIEPALKEMADTALSNVWALREKDSDTLSVPGPVIVVNAGTTFRLKLNNENLYETDYGVPHRLCIPGVFDTGVVLPGDSVTVEFTAPPGGTYLYYDPENAPVNRLMGLYGALISLPENFGDPGHLSPYSAPTQQIQDLFNDLGTDNPNGATHFPGDPWDVRRSWIWLFATHDPAKHMATQQAAYLGFQTDPAEFVNGYVPRYFEISGKNGYFSSTDVNISPWGNCGMPAMLRCLNAGLAWFSPHIHGNHVYQLTHDGQVLDNLPWLDTWTMAPMQRKDLLHPFIIPPDINVWPPSPQDAHVGPVSQFPLVYPMHCHNELSQTASGGNYPQGALVHWTILTSQIGGPVQTDLPENPQVRFEPFMDVFTG